MAAIPFRSPRHLLISLWIHGHCRCRPKAWKAAGTRRARTRRRPARSHRVSCGSCTGGDTSDSTAWSPRTSIACGACGVRRSGCRSLASGRSRSRAYTRCSSASTPSSMALTSSARRRCRARSTTGWPRFRAFARTPPLSRRPWSGRAPGRRRACRRIGAAGTPGGGRRWRVPSSGSGPSRRHVSPRPGAAARRGACTLVNSTVCACGASLRRCGSARRGAAPWLASSRPDARCLEGDASATAAGVALQEQEEEEEDAAVA